VSVFASRFCDLLAVSIGRCRNRCLQCAFRPSHPVSPDALDFDRRNELLAQGRYLRALVPTHCLVASLNAAQTRGAPRAIAVLEIVFVVGIFGVAEHSGTALRHARGRERVRGRDNRRDERIPMAPESRRIAGHERLRRRRLPCGREHGCVDARGGVRK
jgi:hypothetical protein